MEIDSDKAIVRSPLLVEDDRLKRLFRRDLLLTFVVLVALFIGVVVSSLLFGEAIKSFTGWMANSFGLVGLSALIFVSDSFVSPLPPDLVLLVIAKSDLRSTWWWSVPLIGFISMLAGHFGWLIGRFIRRSSWGRYLAGPRLQQQQQLVEKYGVWAVVLGAATPVPYSVTCWAAGFLNMPWRRFALASLFRIPRFVLYYVVIHLSDWVV
jgi:membrane protein YqaA with SNARE-associated domain